MSAENCPGRQICKEDLVRIEKAFSMEEIKATRARSLREGWKAFRDNENKLAGVGIKVEKGQGRCVDCPIEIYVEKEGRHNPT